MPLHIETGHPITNDIQVLPVKGVRFVTDDNRTMFEVHIGQDGRSIEVRGVDVTKVGDMLYGSSLAACPEAANSLMICVLPYDE
jgi:hypothetical protein